MSSSLSAYSLSQGLSLICWASWPMDHLIPPPLVLRSQTHSAPPNFYVGVGDPRSGHTRMVQNTLPSESASHLPWAPQLSSFLTWSQLACSPFGSSL